MTQKQLIGIARRLGALAGQVGIDESTRRECVDVIENIANTAGGFEQVKAGCTTGKISLQDWRKLARTDRSIKTRTQETTTPVDPTNTEGANAVARATASHRLMRENTDLDNKS